MELKFKHFIIVFFIVLAGSVSFALIYNSGFFERYFPQASMDGLANSSWPMAGHDRQHTGRSLVNGPSTNNTKWAFDLGNWIDSPPVIGSDGTIYIIASQTAAITQCYLYAINPDGTLKWRTNNSIEHSINTPILVSKDGTIYITATGYLYAFDGNGNVKWVYKVEGSHPSSSAPSIAGDGTIYFASNGRLYAINPDGKLKWVDSKNDLNLEFGGPIVGSDGTIYAVGVDSHSYFVAINPDGKIKWKYLVSNDSDKTAGAPAIGSDGVIYFGLWLGMSGNYFCALNPDGTLKWTYALKSTEEFANAPTIAQDGTIYFSVDEVQNVKSGIIYALNHDGSLKWRYETDYDNPIESSFVIDPEGTIYFVSNYAYALYPNKTIKWQRHMKGQAKGYLAMGKDGTLYVTSTDNQYLYAIK